MTGVISALPFNHRVGGSLENLILTRLVAVWTIVVVYWVLKGKWSSGQSSKKLSWLFSLFVIHLKDALYFKSYVKIIHLKFNTFS